MVNRRVRRRNRRIARAQISAKTVKTSSSTAMILWEVSSPSSKGSMLTSRDLVCKGYGPSKDIIGEILDKMFDAASKTYVYAAERMEEARKRLKITTRTIIRKVKTATAKFVTAAKPTVDRTASGIKSVMVKLRPHLDHAYSWVKSTASSLFDAVIAVAS